VAEVEALVDVVEEIFSEGTMLSIISANPMVCFIFVSFYNNFA